MSKSAYAVLAIDKQTREVVGVGVFSEPQPTMAHFSMVLFCKEALTFEQAYQMAACELESHSEYSWLRPVMERKRDKLGFSGDLLTFGDRIQELEDRVALLEGVVVP